MADRGINFTAVLLAGEGSDGMGVESATRFHRDGLPLWLHQMHVLDQTNPDYLLVTAAQEPSWTYEELIWVRDDQPELGPISAIASALKMCSTSHLICLAMDLGEMIPQDLQYFCSCCTNGIGLVPWCEAGWEPLAAVLPREAAVDVRDFMASGQTDLQILMDHLQQQGKIRPYPIPEHEIGLYAKVSHSKSD